MNEERDKRLFSHTPNSYSGEYDSHLLEQYKLYVQSADNFSARRVSSNNFLLTLNSAIIALYGINAAFAGIDNWISRHSIRRAARVLGLVHDDSFVPQSQRCQIHDH